MAFDQCFSNQSSVFSISVMVVDDDPVFLQVMERMLEKSKYRDPSIMELTIIAAKNSTEALSTLKIQKNNIDLIVTDYYMPGMNGLQLKAEITREFGNLPVIVISSDSNKEEESLSCGAKCFIPKPIKAIDLTKIYELAITYKRNGKSTLQSEHNHKETDNSVPKQIQLLPEQAIVLNTKKTTCLIRSDSRSVNNTNESCVSTNGSQKNSKRKSINGDVESSRPSKKKKITWTDFLHDRFLQAIRHIGLDKAVPKKILEFMNVSDLTRENVASHLQKYRIFLRKVAEEGLVHSNTRSSRDISSMLPNAHFKELYDNYFKHSSSWYDTSLNDRSFYSQPRLSFGQSRLLSNSRESSVRFNPIPYNYMNRSPTYEPVRHIGSNLMVPIRSNLNFSNQHVMESNGGPEGQTLMASKMGQTSQTLGFGQHGVSSNHGNNFDKNMMSNYGSSTPNQPTLSSYGSFTPNQPGLNNYRTPSLYQPGLSSYGSLTSYQLSNYGSLTPSQPRLNGYGSLTSTQSGLKSYGTSTLNEPELSSFRSSSTPNQPRLLSYGNSTFNQPDLSSYGSATHNQLEQINNESPIQNQPVGSSHFGYGMQSFLNTENASYQPQTHTNTTTQPTVEIPRLENLNFYDDFSKTNEFSCNISNFPFDQNKEQGEANNFEPPAKFPTELDQIFSLQKDDDWTLVNKNQGHSNGETSNTFVIPETNSTAFNMNPNHNQEQDQEFVDWSLLDMQDLVDDDFMNSLFNIDMN